MNHKFALQPQPYYFPLASGKYVVNVGLHPLTQDFGNGPLDDKRLQLDDRYFDYRRQKLQARCEKLGKYYRKNRLSPALQQSLVGYLMDALIEEYPQWFQRHIASNGAQTLACALTQERLYLDENLQLRTVAYVEQTDSQPQPGYVDAVDALASQIQEDVCVCELIGESNRLSLLHLCFPNHWSAEDKIGKSFAEVHRPVPGMQHILRKESPLLRLLSQRGPWVRFAWGLATDDRLNHHPQAPESTDPAAWRGRKIDDQNPQLFLRCERQVTQVLIPNQAFVFTIRTYFQPIQQLSPQALQAVMDAITSMDELTLGYKGLLSSKPAILAWLKKLHRDSSAIKGGKNGG